MIKKIIRLHKFFMKEGLDFVRINPIIYESYERNGVYVEIKNKGEITLKNKLYIPIAYIRFMYASLIKDSKFNI